MIKSFFSVDHTRVILNQATASLAKKGRRALLGSSGSGDEVLDANYVDGGPDRPRAYVATAAPSTRAAFAHFWSLVWESGARTIACADIPAECGRRRCERYWPPVGENGSGAGEDCHGHLRVASAGPDEVRAHYVVRRIRVYSTR